MVSPLNHRLHRFKTKITQIILLVTGYWLLVTNCNAQPSNYVRVAIMQGATSLNLKASGSYEIIDSNNKKIVSGGRNLKTTATLYKDGILIGGMNFNTDKLFIKTRNPDLIMINGRLLRGDIQLIKGRDAKFTVINYIELEDYIKGISVREISHYWPMEALKAQAIAFRTFALYQAQENKGKDYDLTSDIYSQVYGGRSSERYRINKAVDQTRNYVLTFQGKIFPTFYHATCAGYTQDASLLWQINIAPLKGVRCDFCKDSPHFSWHRVMSQDELKEKLKEAGYQIKKIKDIVIVDRDKSSRIMNLKIITDEEKINISAKDFRNIIGPNIIKSTNFSVSIVDSDAVFVGFGWGHGVGLCQWGAYFMARQGYTYKKILQYYYPGSIISLIAKN